MSSIKDFIANGFMNDPQRYGTDVGDLHMVNDYLSSRGWDTLTREQFAGVTSTIRLRNMFLADNPNYDLRKQHKAPKFKQLSIYDFLDDDAATQTKKLTRYYTYDQSRLQQSNTETKQNVQGVDDDHITAVKIMLPLFASDPRLRKIRVNDDHELRELQLQDLQELEEELQLSLRDEETEE